MRLCIWLSFWAVDIDILINEWVDKSKVVGGFVLCNFDDQAFWKWMVNVFLEVLEKRLGRAIRDLLSIRSV